MIIPHIDNMLSKIHKLITVTNLKTVGNANRNGRISMFKRLTKIPLFTMT